MSLTEKQNLEVDWFLNNYAKYMRSPENNLGFAESKYIKISGSKTFDDMVEDLDTKLAQVVCTILDDIDEIYKDYINAIYLGSKRKYRDTLDIDKKSSEIVYNELKTRGFIHE